MGTKAKYRGGVLEFYDSGSHERVLPVAPVAYVDDFLGQAIDATNDWTLLDTAGATEALVADAPNGVLALALTNTNEAQLSGISKGDQKTWLIANGVQFEARVRFTVLPTGAVVAAIGLAGDHNAAADTVAESIWFRADGNGTITVETDDITLETSLVATGIAFLVNEWHVLRIDVTDPTDVRFYIDGNQVAAATNFNVNSVATLALQPYIRMSKGVATTVGTLQVDYVRVWQDRD